MTEIGTQCGVFDETSKIIANTLPGRSKSPDQNIGRLPLTLETLAKFVAVPRIERRRHSLDDGRGKAIRLAELETIHEVDPRHQAQKRNEAGRRSSTGLPELKQSLGSRPRTSAGSELSTLSVSSSDVFGDPGYLKPTKASITNHADLEKVHTLVEKSIYVRERRRISYPQVSLNVHGKYNYCTDNDQDKTGTGTITLIKKAYCSQPEETIYVLFVSCGLIVVIHNFVRRQKEESKQERGCASAAAIG